MKHLLSAFLLLLTFFRTASADPVPGQRDFPAGALVNVNSFGAKGDGVTDDTAAIQAAITANAGTHSTVYFPSGVYLVSDTLEWKKPDGKWGVYLSLQGQNRDHTRIVLKSGSAGFDNPDAPKPVFITGDQTGADHGNQAFQNCFYDLTVEIARDNAGAVAIDYLASNLGTIKNVTVLARGPAVAGISMTRAWPGPCLLKDVRVEGCQYGIQIGQGQYSITLEEIALAGQTVSGIDNDGNAIFLRHLVSRNRVPAIRNLKPQSFAVVLNSSLADGDAAASAIVNAGKLYARDVAVSGYGRSINALASDALKGEYSSDKVLNLWDDSPRRHLMLPIEETPDIPYDANMDHWASVQSYMKDVEITATDRESDTAAIRAALASGKSTIYFPVKTPGGQAARYWIDGTLTVPATVERITGLGASVGIRRSGFQDPAHPQPIFHVTGATSSPLVVERFSAGVAGQGPEFAAVWLLHESHRPLVVQDMIFGGKYAPYQSTPISGTVFLQDVVAGNWQFHKPGQKVFARQFNVENRTLPKIVNAGADLWILGMKTEGGSRILEASGGSKTELLGGFFFPVEAPPAGEPAISLTDAQFSGSFVTTASLADRVYPFTVRETRQGVTKEVPYAQTPVLRGFGRAVVLFSGVPPDVREDLP